MQEKIKQVLASYKVKGDVFGVEYGARIDRFLFKPAEGVKISQICKVSDDLALNLGVDSVSVIRGRGFVGLDIPKENPKTVLFSQFSFSLDNKKLPVAIGESVGGKPFYFDLAAAPHLLVAGTTGSGKSVFLNCLINSLIKTHTPEQLKFVLIDVKRVEFLPYENISYLLKPIITEPEEAESMLDFLVAEMESRYSTLSAAGYRNIADYNEKGGNMPYIVCVIDEFADLMSLKKSNIEIDVQRLAQKARACGIHLVIATQRPSVDVLTGVIKANIPTRLAFQVANKTDSRVIIDEGGAEKLTGKGDCLFYTPGKQPERIAGAFISDSEIKANTEPYFCEYAQEEPEEQDSNSRGKKTALFWFLFCLGFLSLCLLNFAWWGLFYCWFMAFLFLIGVFGKDEEN